jgi:hypothetical protein
MASALVRVRMRSTRAVALGGLRNVTYIDQGDVDDEWRRREGRTEERMKAKGVCWSEESARREMDG